MDNPEPTFIPPRTDDVAIGKVYEDDDDIALMMMEGDDDEWL